MINTNVIPVGTASATSQTLVVEAYETLCRQYCVLNQTPTVSMVFSAGTPKLVGAYAIVPVEVTVTVTSATNTNCGCAHVQTFTESFDVGFTATTANSITLTPGSTTLVEPYKTNCCKAKGVKASTTLNIAIA